MPHIVATLFPVFAVLLLGYLLGRRGFFSRAFLNDLNRYVYYIALPALMVEGVAGAEELPGEVLPTLLAYMGATSIVMGLAYLVARALKLKRWQYGTFIQASFRGNIGFIGLPILVYAIRDLPQAEVSRIVAQAVFVFAPVMIFYNFFAVIFLIGSQESASRRDFRKTLKGLATNPLIIAAIVGILAFLLPFNLPSPLMNTLDLLGKTAAPMALICVGGGIAVVDMQGRYRSATFASLLKTAGAPLAAYLVSLPFNLSPTSLMILMIFASTPTAVASYVMAKEMHGDEGMASGAIVLSTLFSIVSLGIAVGLLVSSG